LGFEDYVGLVGYSWIVAVVNVRRQYGRQIQEFEVTPYYAQEP
jgi:hypothetical protein